MGLFIKGCYKDTESRMSFGYSALPCIQLYQIYIESLLTVALGFALSLPFRILLRRLTHCNAFSFKGLSSAWGSHQLTQQDIFRYKLASMAKGFESSFFIFVSSQSQGANSRKEDTDQIVRMSGSLIEGVSQVDVM